MLEDNLAGLIFHRWHVARERLLIPGCLGAPSSRGRSIIFILRLGRAAADYSFVVKIEGIGSAAAGVIRRSTITLRTRGRRVRKTRAGQWRRHEIHLAQCLARRQEHETWLGRR